MSLQQIHSETKYPLRHLDALEHGLLSVLPGGVYRRNETRAYARIVGLDESVALAALERGLEALGLREIAPTESPYPEWYERENLRVLIVVALVVAAALALSALPSGSGLGDRAAQHAGVKTGLGSLADVRPPLPREPLPPIVSPTPKPTEVARVEERAPGPVVASSADAALAPDSGQLVVITEPEGARLTVDGIGFGTTPLTIRHLRFGDRQVRVTKEGYLAAEHVAHLDQTHATRTITITLSPASRGTAQEQPE